MKDTKEEKGRRVREEIRKFLKEAITYSPGGGKMRNIIFFPD